MVFIVQHLGEIVVQGIGITITRTEGFLVLIGRRVLHSGVVGHVISGHTVETVIRLRIFLQAAFNLETQVVNNFPVKSGIGIPGGTDTTGVVVGHRPKRRSIVAIVLLFVHPYRRSDNRDRSIGNRMFETTVTGSGTRIVDAVGTAAANIHAGITDIGVDGRSGRSLEVSLEIQVVTGVVGTHHDSLVAHVGVADGPVHII